ncbi:MAG: glycosyl transferase family protein [Sneathiellaceae bacterium]
MIGAEWTLDLLAAYWFGVYVILVLAAIGNILSSLDDLFVDLTYWIWRLYRGLIVRPRHDRLTVAELRRNPQQPIAILVPAWDEANVIGHMLDLAVSSFDYDRYRIYVGTYPNDPETQEAVDRVAADSPNVRKVVTRNPGPTSKADALNHCLEAAFQDEADSGEAYAAFVLHDAEDVVHPLEMLLFNHLIPRKDLVQLPVFSLEREWWQMTGGHYQDEFAEVHSKDLVVREWLAGQVPSAGVGTAFSRRAILALLEDSDGEVFDESSLTEDYEISFRLKRRQMTEIFVRFPIEIEVTRRNILGTPRQQCRPEWVAVREYFPDAFWSAVRQKARWLTGIVFQGSRRIGWRGAFALRYFLMRDRKALFTNLVNMLGYFVLINAVAMSVYEALVPDSIQLPPLVIPYGPLWWLLLANGLFLLNRILHRIWFTWTVYGPYAAILSVPRQVWGNFINFFACVRAIRRVIASVRGKQKLDWEKTSHSFPGAEQMKIRSKRMGELRP